jgi:hypothetical protein
VRRRASAPLPIEPTLIDLPNDGPRKARQLRRASCARSKNLGKAAESQRGKIQLEVPITVRSLSEAIGMRAGELLMKLLSHGAARNISINSSVEPAIAELVAVEYGRAIEFRYPADIEHHPAATTPDNAENLQPPREAPLQDDQVLARESFQGYVLQVTDEGVFVQYDTGDDLVEQFYRKDQFQPGKVPARGDRIVVDVAVRTLPPLDARATEGGVDEYRRKNVVSGDLRF